MNGAPLPPLTSPFDAWTTSLMVLLLWGAVLLPGLLWMSRPGTLTGRAERFVLGACGSFALFVYLNYLDLRYLGLGRAIPWLWLAICLGSLFRLQREALRGLFVRPDRTGWILPAILSLTVIVRLPVLYASILPPGYDPTNHLLLARMIGATGSIPSNWEPFEPVALNYPVGLHGALAVLNQALVIGLVPLWKALYPLLSLLTVMVLYGLGSELPGGRRSGLWVAGSYSFLAQMGGIEYYAWGGMVNQAGVLTSLALLQLCLVLRRRRPDAWRSPGWLLLGATLFTASYLIHHHVMVACGLMLITVIVAAALKRPLWPLARYLFLALAISGFMGCMYLVPFALRSRTVGETRALTYLEPFLGLNLFHGVGYVFFSLTLFGLCSFIRKARELPEVWALAASVLGFVGMFVLLEYVVQGWWYFTRGERITPMAPSRFLTDAVPLLALIAGPTLAAIWTRIGRLPKPARLSLSVMLALLLLSQPLYYFSRMYPYLPPPDLYRSLVWIRDNTDPDCFVLNSPAHPWVCAVTWRESAYTPLSGSEPAVDKSNAIQAMLDRGDRPTYTIGFDPRTRPVFEAGIYSVYRVR